MIHWRQTKVETTGATQDYETLISRLFETFLYFETKKQVVPWHQWHHLVRRHCIYKYTKNQSKNALHTSISIQLLAYRNCQSNHSLVIAM